MFLKNHKRGLLLFLSILLCVVIAGCGSKKLENDTTYTKATKNGEFKKVTESITTESTTKSEETSENINVEKTKKDSDETTENEQKKQEDQKTSEAKERAKEKQQNPKTVEKKSLKKQQTESTTKKSSKSDKKSLQKTTSKNKNVSSGTKNETTKENPGQRYITKSDGTNSTEDKYHTDPVPAGKQNPVEPGDVKVDHDASSTCSLIVECSTILKNMNKLTKGKESLVPKDGIIYKNDKVVFYDGESVSDILKREMKNNSIHLEYNFTPGFNSDYIEGIGNLYEFDCGNLSGWTYCVNGWFPNYGCSRYVVTKGDKIIWRYTCDLGKDVGADIN